MTLTVRELEGVFFQNSRTTFAKLRDGSSNTILLGERSGFVESYNPDLNDGSNFFSSSWIGLAGGSFFEGWRVVAWCAEPPNNDVVADINFYGFAKFSSAHPGVTNFALCDGSTQSISNDISPQTFRALGSISGGEIVGEY